MVADAFRKNIYIPAKLEQLTWVTFSLSAQ